MPETNLAMKSFDADALSRSEQYKVLTGTVVPRPIALVTTEGPHGVNAAPFSFFNVLGVDPPLVMFSIGMRPDTEKDTLRNLRAHPELVVHLVDEANAQRMHLCGGAYSPEVNELALAGFETLPSDRVSPPRIASCPVHFECVVDRLMPFGAVPYTLVVARILKIHVRDDIVDAGLHVDLRALNPISRVTGPGMYGRTTDCFSLPPVA